MLCIPTTPLQLQETTLQRELSEGPCSLPFIRLFFVLTLQQFSENQVHHSLINHNNSVIHKHFSNMQTFDQLVASDNFKT